MPSMKRGMLTALALIALAAPDATAGQYPGRGDTGWVLAGKRDCCNEAIALAQQDSAAVCHNTGGSPSPMRGGVQRRGYCQWESAVGNDGLTRFHCWAEATIPCR